MDTKRSPKYVIEYLLYYKKIHYDAQKRGRESKDFLYMHGGTISGVLRHIYYVDKNVDFKSLGSYRLHSQ